MIIDIKFMIFGILQSLHCGQEMDGDYFGQMIQSLFHIIFAKIFIVFPIFSFPFIASKLTVQRFNNSNLQS